MRNEAWELLVDGCEATHDVKEIAKFFMQASIVFTIWRNASVNGKRRPASVAA